jgi:hypothetical protein
MATNDFDICNRALIDMASKKVISSLQQDSIEAKTFNLVYVAIRDWCLCLANWNFARRTAFMGTVIKQIPAPPPPVPWNGTTTPAPPWLLEYQIPSDYLKAQYITNSAADPSNTFYAGEMQRFVIAQDGVNNKVLLTSQTNPVLVYTAQITDPTQWTPWFERIVVSALSWKTGGVLAPEPLRFSLDFIMALKQAFVEALSIGVRANIEEGSLVPADATPELIQARGLEYPEMRLNRIERQLEMMQKAQDGRRSSS